LCKVIILIEGSDLDELSFSNLSYLDEQYRKYLADPASLEPSWKHFFEGWEIGRSAGGGGGDVKVDHLIQAYRTYGHLRAHFNCLIAGACPDVPELNLKTYGFSESDLKTIFPTEGFLKAADARLEEILSELEKTYCGSIGIEYMGIQNPEIEKWIQKEIEPGFPIPLTPEEKLGIFHDLNRAELFEMFLHTKYVGQKRFSLEGGETLIPMLTKIVSSASQEGVHEVVLGMAHRGRLNVLANLLNKSYEAIFSEFEDVYIPDVDEGTGDVKYHKGFTGNFGDVSVVLTANPSHLEAVDPVVEGQTRARQELRGRKEVIPILIHGDASVAGQGVVYETLQLSKLVGYQTGGTVHIVINNQIGFTTLPKDGRSTRYCTDIALSFGAPVFHVNAEDPDACVYAALLALKIRQKFHIDVFIDLNCYRKYGHNEGDEPAFTQPQQYEIIRAKKTIRSLYLEKLTSSGLMSPAVGIAAETEFKDKLQKALDQVSSKPPVERQVSASKEEVINTAVSAEALQKYAQELCKVPAGFNIHPKVSKLQDDRLAMLASNKIDWGMGEHLAYASLLADAVHIRISGQDSRRGTFSHRHAVWVDQKTEGRYYPLSHLESSKAPFDIFNSPLSEFAVLGFEFGYSLFYPNSLVIWEAQYGDFANGAQTIIDQFIASSEQKWGHRSGLTLFLPHGYEDQGPEHSSARLERYLQLSGSNNWTIANCTSPAQLFHLLRRQALQKVKRPLVLLTPKALLRHPQCVSSLSDFATGSFQEVIPDSSVKKPRRVIFCSGRVYYDLIANRKTPDVAIVRIEQLYPLPLEKIKNVIQTYSGAQDWCWVQEEPRNMGAWSYIFPQLNSVTPKAVRYVGRESSSSPATGSHVIHRAQLAAFMQEAFK
jgi:2-oxoglutarate dehydrogenase E1 component